MKEDANRISRHWYDISMLAKHEIGKQAQINHELLKEVIKVKKTFYDSGFARYDDCLNGSLHLIPNDNYLNLLKDDFKKMIDNKMFYREQPIFDNVISEIKILENTMHGNKY